MGRKGILDLIIFSELGFTGLEDGRILVCLNKSKLQLK